MGANIQLGYSHMPELRCIMLMLPLGVGEVPGALMVLSKNFSMPFCRGGGSYYNPTPPGQKIAHVYTGCCATECCCCHMYKINVCGDVQRQHSAASVMRTAGVVAVTDDDDMQD